MHWYVVHTKPRQEKCALRNLEQQGYECYLPFFPMERLRQGALTLCDEALFPRYLFTRLGQSESVKSLAPIRSTKGVSRLVSFGTEPAKVDNELIEMLRAQEAAARRNPERMFRDGERVRMTQGTFAGIQGVYQMRDGERRAMVLIELLGRPVAVPVRSATLRKVG